MPAVTFMHSTTHRSETCGVRMARSANTLPVVIMARGRSVAGVHPRGRQSGRGIRTVNTPNIMKQKYRIPSVTKVDATPGTLSVLKYAMSVVESGDAIM